MPKVLKITILGALIIITSFIVSKKSLLADKSEYTGIVESHTLEEETKEAEYAE